MKIFAIGDVQGCFDELQLLLKSLAFQPGIDKLWFTGDLVNRGPQSLEVLRYVKSLGNSAITALGNHDLHLLAVASDHSRLAHGDTLLPILEATDREDLLNWLRFRPLCHYDADLNCLLIHAGLPPQWSINNTIQYAQEVESILQGDNFEDYFGKMYGDMPRFWCNSLTGWDRYRYITNALTRMRYIDNSNGLCLSAKGPLGTQPHDCVPWFDAAERKSRGTTIVFGHWSTLGYYCQKNVIALDSGCLWGGALTAVDITDKTPTKTFQIKCNGRRKPQLSI